MKKEAEILFLLLRVAISNRSEFPPQNIDWENVFELALRQGVRGIAFEGLEIIKKEATDKLSFPSRDILLKWYAQSVLVEKKYCQQKRLSEEFAAILKKYGIKTIVFKGLAHSRFFPNPVHREFGDFDCYLIDSKGKAAYNKGNEVAKLIGCTVDDSWYKHSKISFNGLTIENHKYITPARRGGTDKLLNDYLINAIGNANSLDAIDDTDVYILPNEAEGLFMLYHSLMHFLVEGITLRHFVDWACWIKANQDKLQWCDFYAQCKRFRLDGFVDVMNTIAVKYLGIIVNDKTLVVDSPYADRTIESALYDDYKIKNRGKGRWHERYGVIKNAFRFSWKYRNVAHYSMIGYLWQFVYGFLRRGEED